MVLAAITFAHGDKTTCLKHMSRISIHLRPVLSSYYDSMHDKVIALSAWLSRIQGFYAWGAGYVDEVGQI
jgi:hypothetical protein